MPNELSWALELVNYGVLGVFALFVMVVLWKTGNSLWEIFFSRDKDNPGVVFRLTESSIKKDEKMSQFMDALAEREVMQQDLCRLHATELVQIGGIVKEHDKKAEAGFNDIMILKGLARRACQIARTLARNEWPSSRQEVDEICSEIEAEVDRRA